MVRLKNGLLAIGYDMLPSQAAFHDSEALFKGFSGPVGSGKSAALAHEAMRLAIENNGFTGLLGAPTYQMLKDATLPHLLATLQRNDVAYEHKQSDQVVTLKEWNSTILLRSLDNPDSLRGTNLAWFGVDELTYAPEAAWQQLESRLREPAAPRLCGFGVWTPKGQDWVYRRLVANERADTECIRAKPFENRFILNQLPRYYEGLKDTFDSAFYAQEVLGEYLSAQSNLVYRRFSRAKNVEPQEYDPQLPLLWALDFNVDPMSSVLAQIRGEHVHVLDEIVLKRVTTHEACEEFAARFPACPAGVKVYADASAHADKTSGWSDREALQDFFSRHARYDVSFHIPKSNPPVRRRVELMNGKLEAATGFSNMTIDPRCTELIKDLEEVAWVEGAHEIDKAKDSKRTHLSDALGYLVWFEFRELEGSVGYRVKRPF